MENNLYSTTQDSLYQAPEEIEQFNLAMTDDKLDQLLIRSLEKDLQYWNKPPYSLQETDSENVNFLLGNQLPTLNSLIQNDDKYIDNRIFSSTRAILSYTSANLAKPELTPSSSNQQSKDIARNMERALYQHSIDEHVDEKVRAAIFNLISRKRAFLKLRFDLDLGPDGDIITEVADPKDVIVDRRSTFGQEPQTIYHRVPKSLDELCALFPAQKDKIYKAAKISQGRFSQLDQELTIFEAWFSYRNDQLKLKEGLAWFYPNEHLILDKTPNPNWIYTGDDKQDKITNLTPKPPKPFVWFNYLNLGNSFIDETSLIDQAKPSQKLVNERQRQLHENISYANGRWVASKKAFTEQDANKLVNKGPKTVAMTTADDATKAIANVAAASQANEIFQTLLDARNEVNEMMGTSTIFKGGADPKNNDTLGRDQMLKQQSSIQQDDLVRAITTGMARFYTLKAQLMRVFYEEDHEFATKGGDGEYAFVTIGAETLDTNVKISVQADSTLPLDKPAIRQLASELLKANKIDYLTAMEDLGLPDPDIRTERFLRSQLNPFGYLTSVEASMDNNDAEQDIALLIQGKTPKERDDYSAQYFTYFNRQLASNRFQILLQTDPQAAQRVTGFLMATQHAAQQSADLQQTAGIPDPALDEAGQLDQAPLPPMPMPKVNIRLNGALDPAETQKYAGGPPPQQQPQPPK